MRHLVGYVQRPKAGIMQNISFHTAKTTDFLISLWQKTQTCQNSQLQNGHIFGLVK